MYGSRGTGGPDTPPPRTITKYRVSSNTASDPLKNRSYQASIQCWAIIGTPAKRAFMAFRRRTNDGPLIVYSDLPSPHQLKKKKKKKKHCQSGPPLTKLS